MNITGHMRREADERRRAGPINGCRIVADPELKPLREPADYPEDYREWWERQADSGSGKLWPEPVCEWRDGGWYHMKSGKRVHTLRERSEAVSLFRSGTSASIVAERFGTAPATVRTWAYRERQDDLKVASLPRFMPA